MASDSIMPAWDRRMTALNENWEASRSFLFNITVSAQGSFGSSVCMQCQERQWMLQCVECGSKRLCSACDAQVHEQYPFHDREAFVDGCFKHIPPTISVDESGKLKETGMFLKVQSNSANGHLP